jgi:hypothetical protein
MGRLVAVFGIPVVPEGPAADRKVNKLNTGTEPSAPIQNIGAER